MKRNLKITEEQYKQAIAEGITLNADVSASNGDVKQAIENTKREAQRNGVDLKKATIQIPADNVSETRIITKKELMENRLKVLKEHSDLFTYENFITKLKNNQ